jgi:hypothetical protein
LHISAISERPDCFLLYLKDRSQQIFPDQIRKMASQNISFREPLYADTKSSGAPISKKEFEGSIAPFQDAPSEDEFQEAELDEDKPRRRPIYAFVIGFLILSAAMWTIYHHVYVPCRTHLRSTVLQKRAADEPAVCINPTCKEYAKQIQANLAKNYASLDPCEDFNVYSCQGWMDSHDFRSDQSVVSSGAIMGDTIKTLLRGILEGDYATNNKTIDVPQRNFDMENFQKMKDAYQTCMNEDAIKEYGTTPVKEVLERFATVFPRKGPSFSEKTKDELTKTIIWLQKNGVSGIIESDTGADDKNPDTVIIQLGSSELSMGKAYYKKPGTVKNLTTAVVGMKKIMDSGKPLFDAPITESDRPALEEYGKNVVGFELTVAENIPEPEISANADVCFTSEMRFRVQANNYIVLLPTQKTGRG